MMLKSLYSGNLNELDVPVAAEQLERWHKQGEPLFVAIPGLNANQVQFLVSGMTPGERVARFGPVR